MSISSNKRRARRRAEELKGGVFPSISFYRNELGIGLLWSYRMAQEELCLCVPFEDYDGNLCPYLSIESTGETVDLDGEHVQQEVERKFQAMTRVRLLHRHVDRVRSAFPENTALADLHTEATTLGLYGKREPLRPCIVINSCKGTMHEAR